MANLLGATISQEDPNAKEKVLQTLKDFYRPLNLLRDISSFGATDKDIDKLVEDTFATMKFCVDINAQEANTSSVRAIYKESLMQPSKVF